MSQTTLSWSANRYRRFIYNSVMPPSYSGNRYNYKTEYAKTENTTPYVHRAYDRGVTSLGIQFEAETVYLTVITFGQISTDWSAQSLTLSWSASAAGLQIGVAVPTSPISSGSAGSVFEDAVNRPLNEVTYAAGTTSVTLTDSTADNAVRYGIVLKVAYGGTGNATLSDFDAVLNYIDTSERPQAAAISPAGQSVIGSEAITFKWSYSHREGFPQASFTLQTSGDDGTTWTTRATGTTAKQATVAANTFGAGSLAWRVIVSDGTLQNTSPTAYCIVRYQPSSSDVSLDNLPRLTVSWSATDQAAFRLKVGDWDSGSRFGSAQSYTLPLILSDGVYPVSLRTQTSAGEWSDWTEEIWAEIANDPPAGELLLSVRQEAFSAVLSWEYSGNEAIDSYVVYRDGEPIAVTGQSAASYTDDEASGYAVYTVRGLSPSGYYIESEAATLLCLIRWDCIKTKDGPWLPLKYSTDIPVRSYVHGSDVSFRHYAGREKPVAVTMGHRTRTGSFQAAFLNREPAERLIAMVGREVVRKDSKGGVIRGVMTDAALTSEQLYAVAYSVTETDQARKGELPDDQ